MPDPSQAPRPATALPDPVSISIPEIGVERMLVPLGLNEERALEVPDDPDDVGWFTGGGRPGGPGPVVVVGHVDSTTGPAVFARLPELTEGDRIELEDADGRQAVYEVTATRDVPQDDFPTEDVFGRTTDDRLQLITCTGDYDRTAGRYLENRLVTAERV